MPASTATWKVAATQVMAMAFDSAPGQTVNVDGWDGYGRERREVLEALRAAGTNNFVCITGDVHSFFAGTVHVNGRVTTPAVGTEFVGGSITSLGFEEYFGPTTPVTQEGVRANNPHYAFADWINRGYGVMEARRDELLVTYRSPGTVTEPRSEMRDLARFRVAAGSTAVQRI